MRRTKARLFSIPMCKNQQQEKAAHWSIISNYQKRNAGDKPASTVMSNLAFKAWASLFLPVVPKLGKNLARSFLTISISDCGDEMLP